MNLEGVTVPTNCPDDIALLSFAIGPTSDTRIAAHVERCMSCRDSVVRYRELAASVRRATREANDVRGECLDEMAIAALAEGVAAADARVAATQHLVTCASCRSQLTELRAALDDVSMVNLANLATLRGDYATAGTLYRDALAIRRTASERAREAPVLHNLGLLGLRRGDYVAARDALVQAIAIFDETGPATDAITARTDLAQAQGAMGDLQSALMM